MKNVIVGFLALFIMLSLGGCGIQHAFEGLLNRTVEEPVATVMAISSSETGHHELSYADNTLTVELTENASIGYEWDYTLENDNLVFISDEFNADEKDEVIVGNDSIHIYRFEGIKEGETSLVFQCFWRGNFDELYDKLTIVVEVSSDGSITNASFKDEKPDS